MIPQNNKLIRGLYQATNVQYAFRKKKQLFWNSNVMLEKNNLVEEYLIKKIKKWKNETSDFAHLKFYNF